MLAKRPWIALLAVLLLVSVLVLCGTSLASTPYPSHDHAHDETQSTEGYTYWPSQPHTLTAWQWQQFSASVLRGVPPTSSYAALSNPLPPTVRPDVTAPPPLVDNSNQRQARVPILMYHYISPAPDARDALRVGLSVTPEILEQHLTWLQREGWTTISLYQMHDHLVSGAPLPRKPIVLTFDDGYADNYSNAFPLLKKHGQTATFFVITDFVSKAQGYMTWQQIQEMSTAGMSIENHTRTHPDLRNRSNEFLQAQVQGPIDAITSYTGKRPRFFAYPSGQFDVAAMRVLESAGVWGAVTTQPGVIHQIGNSLTWTRVRVFGNMPVDSLAKTLG